MSLRSSLLGYSRAVRAARRTAGLPLPAAIASVAAARLRHGLGSQFHSLFALGEVPRSEWRRFILDSEFNPLLQQINRRHIPLADDKLAFAAHCLDRGIPTVPIHCVIPGKTRPEQASVRHVRTVHDAAQLERLLADVPGDLFFKLVDGAHGVHAFAAVRSSNGWAFAGKRGGASDIHEHCQARMGNSRGWIVQPAIRGHSALSDIMPGGALGTVRVVTHVASGDPQIILPVLRIPAGGNSADNFSGGRSGNVVAPIDIPTGRLGVGRTSRSTVWPETVSVSAHPETGGPIAGRVVPMWKETVALVLDAQRRTPEFATVGWDIAITDDGPLVVEANPGYDIDLLQVAHNRGIRDDLEPIRSLTHTVP